MQAGLDYYLGVSNITIFLFQLGVHSYLLLLWAASTSTLHQHRQDLNEDFEIWVRTARNKVAGKMLIA